MIPHFGYRVASDDVVTTLQREAEMRAVRIQTHAALLEKERARLAMERDKAERERKRKRRRLAELAAWVTTSAAVLWMLVQGGRP